MIANHTFRGYADHPDICVAELDNGDTCNAEMSEHGHTERTADNQLETGDTQWL